MTLADISNIRLISQRIEGKGFKTAKEIVSWMGAMQAQDYLMSKWAVGIRLQNSMEAKVEDAINKGDIIRIHVMRPTWHYVSAKDIYWMLELTAPQIKTSLKSRHIGLELSEEAIKQGNRLIEKAFYNKKNITREELAKEFEKAKIKTGDNRLAHFLLLAELDGIICSGQIRDNKPSYALLNERIRYNKVLTREESLAELAKRYFSSRCPATINDFAWWSGLPLKDARRGLELVKSDFVSETIGGQTYWMTPSIISIRKDMPSVHLLPAYDEFLISYRDRSPALSEVNNKKTISANGIFHPVIVINGQVTGLWKRSVVKDKVIIETDSFQTYDEVMQDLVKEQASCYGRFLNKEIEVRYKTD
jgi:hypothetical protein